MKLLLTLAALFAAASLLHFAHNAEFLSEYPNLPSSWTRGGVYMAWLGMTAVGSVGCVLVLRGFRIFGLLTLAVYALLGIGSLGHFFLAPFSTHRAAMSVTIILEVGTAALLLAEVIRQAARSIRVRDFPE